MENADVKSMLHDVVLRLKLKREGLQKALAQADAEIRAVETTLDLLNQTLGAAGSIDAALTGAVYNFKGKTQKQCLIEIASRNDGVLKVSEARRILSAAGVLKAKRSAWGAIYTVLTRSKEFEKSGAGEFRLVGFASGPPSSQAQHSHAADATVAKLQ